MRLITGADLVHQLWVAAQMRGVELHDFVEPLALDRRKFINQLRKALHPKPATIARVQALIEGRELPPAANVPQGGPASPYHTPEAAAGRAYGAEEEKARIEARRRLAERAAELRRPGETLADAVRRVANHSEMEAA